MTQIEPPLEHVDLPANPDDDALPEHPATDPSTIPPDEGDKGKP